MGISPDHQSLKLLVSFGKVWHLGIYSKSCWANFILVQTDQRQTFTLC